MTCTKRTSRIIMAAAVLAALIAATVPAASAAPRSTDRTAVTDDGGWGALLGPWHALETWLRNLTGADSGEGGEGGEGGETGGGGSGGETGGDDPPEENTTPPTCPAERSEGPCNDPSG